ncbi:ComEC/Rec2 family competence protein [Mesorhizobium sp. ANAO-SY3R2]|uniref:ComEC/Rec2 family competence protein n=1 Tax=Mesorhizobium sp. ANAO-SY3R2 TaxID=3166644 RepID=UPI00366CF3C7
MTSAFETELDRGAAFLFVPVLLAIGALVYFNLPTEPSPPPLVAASALAVLLALFARSHRLAHYVFAAIAIFLIGVSVAKLETSRKATMMLGAEVSTTLSGRVVEIDHLGTGRTRLTIDVSSTKRPKLRYAPERVRLTARKVPEGVLVGSTVTGYVRLMPPSGPVRPGSYDFSFESYFDGIGASGFFMKGPTLAPSSQAASAASRALVWVENTRNRIAERIRGRIGGAEGEIAAALVVGVRGGIPEDINEALRRTGLYHIISISGLHMAMVAGTVMLLMRLGFAAFPGFTSRRPVKKYAAGAALAATGGYLFISGAEVAAQRSFIMLAVMLTAVLFDRAALTMRNLAVSAIVVILVSPHEVVGPSFQMSFAATAALVAAYAWWSDWREGRAQPLVQRSVPAKIWRWLAAAAVGLVATSLIAGLATSVFGAWHFQRVSPLSLFANLAVMPIVSTLVMPFAVGVGILMPLGLDGIFLDVMGFGLQAMIATAQWFSERSPIDAVGVVSTLSVVFATIALVAASAATTFLRAAALPFAFLVVLTLPFATTPDVLVSEDGRLIGVRTGTGQLAVNRPRPSQFTLDNWKRVLGSEDVVGPRRTDPGSNNLSKTDPAFVCGHGLCLSELAPRIRIAHAENVASARRACAEAALVVVADATARDVCPGSDAEIITTRQLARLGSAAIFVQQASTGRNPKLEILHAVNEPYRPWHVQRQFSREARGLPPYQREDPGRRKLASANQALLPTQAAVNQ